MRKYKRHPHSSVVAAIALALMAQPSHASQHQSIENAIRDASRKAVSATPHQNKILEKAWQRFLPKPTFYSP